MRILHLNRLLTFVCKHKGCLESRCTAHYQCSSLKGLINMYVNMYVCMYQGFLQYSSFTGSFPVRLAYDSTDANSNGEDLLPLVILHGLFGSKTNWRTLAKRFHADTGRQVVTVDARNHGESEHSPQMNYFLQALDVCHLFQELELPKAVVMGHSMGGKTAMTLALTHPESVESLIVVDMSPTKVTLDEDIPRYLATKRAMDLNLVKDKRDAERMLMDVVPNSFLRSFFLTNLVKTKNGFKWRINLEALENNLSEVSSFPTDFPNQQFNGRALFIGGARSDYIRVEEFPAIHRLFPRADIKFIPDSGHWPHAEKPMEFAQIVTQYLDECLQDYHDEFEDEN